MKIFYLISFSLFFTMLALAQTVVNIDTTPLELEVNQRAPISLRVVSDTDGFPKINWNSSLGKIVQSKVVGEVDFIAPETAGIANIEAVITIGKETIKKDFVINVLPVGALKKTADVLIEVDTTTLKNVWVDASHPSENFTPPLKIKGTFRYDPETGLAFAGGSWPTYNMYDDGTHGDKVANDDIWSIKMEFDKSDAGVYIAFDDGSDYRIEFESGIMWRVKMEFIELDEYPDDHSNIKFVADDNKVISWNKELAELGGIYSEK
ncbi:MAG: hypothetical protein JXR64_01045 [Spirochaetales bacterium]|nr:hypothetical protein [Spirochaetales bacterium]